MGKILVTGCSGFIGMHLCRNLLDQGYIICGIDNMNDYYDISLKEKRLESLSKYNNFTFNKIDISNFKDVKKVFKEFKPAKVVNLAAQAGVRYSLENPHIYIETNVVGFTNIIEACRNYDVNGLIYASSSSVYGGNEKSPFSIYDRVDKPISIYAASKKSNELVAHTYSHLYGLNTTGLRFFTVYGPWGRPDMALFKFTKAILEEKPIDVFNHGKHIRDFTYIDDIVNGIYSIINKPKNNKIPFNVFNIGNGNSRKLSDYLFLIEKKLGKKAKIKNLPLQKGDIIKTHADIKLLRNFSNYKSETLTNHFDKIHSLFYLLL